MTRQELRDKMTERAAAVDGTIRRYVWQDFMRAVGSGDTPADLGTLVAQAKIEVRRTHEIAAAWSELAEWLNLARIAEKRQQND